MPQHASGFTRSANACETCRRRKVKCSGTQPCQACSRQGLQCRFGVSTRRGYSEAYVQRLLETIKRQEDKLQDQPQENAPVEVPSSPPPTLDDAPSIRASSSTAAQHDTPLSPATELASGPAFESRVRSIFRDHADSNRALDTSPSNQTVSSSRLEDPPSPQWRNTSDLVKGVPAPALLPRDRSYQLFDAFVSLLGVNQHFLDARNFADSLDLLYKNDESQMRRMDSIWFTEYLLVMAVGMLIGSSSNGSEKPPGNECFAEAMRRVPPLHQLGSHGVISVEILCLIALYLQWCDRKHDAYLYIGTAVRLAVALGCSLPYNEQEGVTSEICHKNRVWWTAYMLDRRLSAGLGLPTGSDDRQLRADFPRTCAGFQPALPMIINIRIARATGEIMTSFYGNTAITQAELVRRIRETLHSLYETGKSIPSSSSIEFSDSQLTISRTSASLYVMLYQAIILCIRPLILQCAKEKVQATKENRPRIPISPVISRLSQSCVEAASKTIQVLSSLKRNGTIAHFGYFDLDATFSAAFVLVMMGFIESNNPKEPPEGLLQASEILQYLSSAGNKAAQERLHELQVFCSHVWTTDDSWRWLNEGNLATPSSSMANPVPSGPIESQETINDNNNNTWLSARTPGLTNVETSGLLFNFESMDAFVEVDLTDEAGDIYSSFNDPALPLTGVDQLDWAEIGKIFQ